jgi:hypothetical protein
MKTLLIIVFISMMSLTSAAETEKSVPAKGRYNVMFIDIKLGDTVMLVTYHLFIGPKDTDILPFKVYSTPDRMSEFRGVTSADLIMVDRKPVGIKCYSKGKKVFEEKLNVPPKLGKPKIII